MQINVQPYVAKNAWKYLDDLAELRVQVFREYPYLYDGNLTYERSYLEKFFSATDSVLVVATDGTKVIGVSTGLPLAEEVDNIKKPWVEHGEDLADIFYFGESVLLPQYRGQGIGKQFFYHREMWARSLKKFRKTCFCAVVRPENHPLKPPGYQTLATFWQQQGYQPMSNYVCYIQWKDINDAEETTKPLQFWQKILDD